MGVKSSIWLSNQYWVGKKYLWNSFRERPSLQCNLLMSNPCLGFPYALEVLGKHWRIVGPQIFGWKKKNTLVKYANADQTF